MAPSPEAVGKGPETIEAERKNEYAKYIVPVVDKIGNCVDSLRGKGILPNALLAVVIDVDSEGTQYIHPVFYTDTETPHGYGRVIGGPSFSEPFPARRTYTSLGRDFVVEYGGAIGRVIYRIGTGPEVDKRGLLTVGRKCKSHQMALLIKSSLDTCSDDNIKRRNAIKESLEKLTDDPKVLEALLKGMRNASKSTPEN